jgi:hypothetical protein
MAEAYPSFFRGKKSVEFNQFNGEAENTFTSKFVILWNAHGCLVWCTLIFFRQWEEFINPNFTLK